MEDSFMPARHSVERPSFMTLPMWFAWLLRSDVRLGKPISDRAAQRNFVIWWLLWGREEYPSIWWYGPLQVEVAMETMWEVDDVSLPRIVCWLWHMRQDLRNQFPLDSGGDAVALLCWYRLYAGTHYANAPELPEKYTSFLMRPSKAVEWVDGPPVPTIAVALRAMNAEVARIFDPTSMAARKHFGDWFAATGYRLLPPSTPLPDWTAAETILFNRKPRTGLGVTRVGVNLVGYAFAEFGIGEDVRALSRALASTGIEHVILDMGTPPGVQSGDRSQERFLSDHLVYPVTIFCATVFDVCELLLKRGPELFQSDLNIGFCPWELPVFPRIWGDAAQLLDEIWAATRFQERAYRSTFGLPITYIPGVIDCPRPEVQHKRRTQFKFIYPFDPRSYLSRKNPVAAIKAFRRAFPRSNRSVLLILRVNGTIKGIDGWQKVITAMRGDRRIVIKAGTMDRRVALAFLKNSDCLISPHRAEGFGRNIVEAIGLGIPVIATSFSGSGDYLRKDERLRSRQKSLTPGEYPFGDEQWWSEPDIADLTTKMRGQVTRRVSSFVLKQRAKGLFAIHGLQPTGRRVYSRLQIIDDAKGQDNSRR